MFTRKNTEMTFTKIGGIDLLVNTVKPDRSFNRFKEMSKNDLGLKQTLKKPCNDCAITYGFYTPIADELLKEDEELQEKCLDNWFCHNHPNECCKGAINY